MVRVFNATFNNISVISWWSVLLVEETRVPRENHWPASSHWQTLSHNVVSRKIVTLDFISLENEYILIYLDQKNCLHLQAPQRLFFLSNYF